MNIIRRTALLSTKIIKNIRQTGTKLYEPDYLEVKKQHYCCVFSVDISLFSGYEIEDSNL